MRFVFHDSPLPQHANTIPAAEAACAAADQGAFWPYHDLLYAKPAEWGNSVQPLDLFASYADLAGRACQLAMEPSGSRAATPLL